MTEQDASSIVSPPQACAPQAREFSETFVTFQHPHWPGRATEGPAEGRRKLVFCHFLPLANAKTARGAVQSHRIDVSNPAPSPASEGPKCKIQCSRS